MSTKLGSNSDEITLVRSVHGSYLYGLNTPTSDKDFKEVFIPELRSVILHGPNLSQNISTKDSKEEGVKNTKDDVDLERFSVGKFFDHLCNGEMIAIDLLHSEPRHWEISTPAWELIVKNRQLFYTSSMKAYFGYIRKQVAKYSFKGSRLNVLQQVADSVYKYLEASGYFNQPVKKGPRLSEIEKCLPVNEYCKFTESEGPNNIKVRFYEVFGTKYMLADYAINVFNSITKYLEGYGKRAKLAAENEGVDWKAVSHAFRASYQALDILSKGGFKYPLEQTDLILKVKTGQMDYKDEVEPLLESLYHQVEAAINSSTYPSSVDEGLKNELLIEIYSKYYGLTETNLSF